MRDADAVARAVEGAEAVIHLAAFGNVADSIADPLGNFDVNARGTLVAWQAAARAGARRFVFASTGGALIGDAPAPVDESSLPRPISPYGASKLCGEGYCHAFRGSYGLETVALRFANVYGPRSEHKQGVVTTLRQARAASGAAGDLRRRQRHAGLHLRRRPLRRHRRRARVARRRGRSSISPPSARRRSPSWRGWSSTSPAPTCPIECVPRRRGEVERNFALARRAAELFGFRAAVSLEDGLARTVEWFSRAGTMTILPTDARRRHALESLGAGGRRVLRLAYVAASVGVRARRGHRRQLRAPRRRRRARGRVAHADRVAGRAARARGAS